MQSRQWHRPQELLRSRRLAPAFWVLLVNLAVTLVGLAETKGQDESPPSDPPAPGAPAPAGEDPAPAYPPRPPAESGWAAPPPPDKDDKPEPDRDRADWQPPESPRGPGGL